MLRELVKTYVPVRGVEVLPLFGRVRLTSCYSKKIGKIYDATVVLEGIVEHINFKLKFNLGISKADHETYKI